MGYVLKHAERSESVRISMQVGLRTGVAGWPIVTGWPGCDLSGEAIYKVSIAEFGHTHSVWESMSGLTFVLVATGDQFPQPRHDVQKKTQIYRWNAESRP